MEKEHTEGISRRSALKRMGTFIAGTAAWGMTSLTGCG